MKKLFVIFFLMSVGSAFAQDRAALVDSLSFRLLLAESAADHLVVAAKYGDSKEACYYVGNLKAGLAGMSYDAAVGNAGTWVSSHLDALKNRMTDASGYCGDSLADTAVKNGDLTGLQNMVMTLPTELSIIKSVLNEQQ